MRFQTTKTTPFTGVVFDEIILAGWRDSTWPAKEKYEELRLILEKQSGRVYTLEEAKEIGDGLIDFYELLARLNTEEGHETQS